MLEIFLFSVLFQFLSSYSPSSSSTAAFWYCCFICWDLTWGLQLRRLSCYSVDYFNKSTFLNYYIVKIIVWILLNLLSSLLLLLISIYYNLKTIVRVGQNYKQFCSHYGIGSSWLEFWFKFWLDLFFQVKKFLIRFTRIVLTNIVVIGSIRLLFCCDSETTSYSATIIVAKLRDSIWKI